MCLLTRVGYHHKSIVSSTTQKSNTKTWSSSSPSPSSYSSSSSSSWSSSSRSTSSWSFSSSQFSPVRGIQRTLRLDPCCLLFPAPCPARTAPCSQLFQSQFCQDWPLWVHYFVRLCFPPLWPQKGETVDPGWSHLLPLLAIMLPRYNLDHHQVARLKGQRSPSCEEWFKWLESADTQSIINRLPKQGHICLWWGMLFKISKWEKLEKKSGRATPPLPWEFPPNFQFSFLEHL